MITVLVIFNKTPYYYKFPDLIRVTFASSLSFEVVEGVGYEEHTWIANPSANRGEH